MKVRSFRRQRLYPTATQGSLLNGLLAANCDLYNGALEQRRRAWRDHGISIGFGQQSKELTGVRAEWPEHTLGQINRWCQTDVLRRLDRAYQDAFDRHRKTGRFSVPRFKSRARYDTLAFDLCCKGGGCKLDLDGKAVAIQGVGRIRFKGDNRFDDAKLIGVNITRKPTGLWQMSVEVEVEVEHRSKTGSVAGIDVGILHDATVASIDAEGEIHEAFMDGPRAMRAAREKLARAQRRLSRSPSMKRDQRRSNRARKKQRTIARHHEHVVNVRADFHHKTTRALVDAHDLIAVEDLKVANMVRRPKARPQPDGSFRPNRAAQKSGLNRSLLDAAPASFILMLERKAAEAGVRVIRVDPRHTSQRCSRCGARQKLTLADRIYDCSSCGLSLDRDVNAARNILADGLKKAGVEEPGQGFRGSLFEATDTARTGRAGGSRDPLARAA